MYHPGTNAEIARLAHVEAVRRPRHARRAEPVVEAPRTRPAAATARLASRLLPELAPSPIPVRIR